MKKTLASFLFLISALLPAPALAQATTTINGLPAAAAPLYCTEVVAAWQIYRTVKLPVAMGGAVCQAATAPAGPFQGQQWFDTSGGTTWVLKVYDGAQWLAIGTLDTSAHTWTASAATIPANQLAIGGSPGLAGLGSLGTTNQVLHGNAAGAPTWGAVDLSTAQVSNTLPTTRLPVGKSVADPGGGTLEALEKVQATTGTNKTYAAADLQKNTIRSNAGSAMADTLPPSGTTGLSDGAAITISNADSAGALTLTASGGTTINSTTSVIMEAGRALSLAYDATNTNWRMIGNSGNAALITNSGNTNNDLVTMDGTAGKVKDSGIASANVVTAASNFTNHGILLGAGTKAPAVTAAPTSGQLLIGQSAADPAPTTVTGDVTISAAGVTAIGTNKVANSQAAQMAANTMKGNWTGSTANAADNAMPSCPDTGSNHLNYVSGTGVTCGTSQTAIAPGSFKTTTYLWQGGRNAYTSFAGFNPTGTTSATKVMMGLGSSWTITPAFSGRVRITVIGFFNQSTTFNSVEQVDIAFGTGAAPANGAAFVGTAAMVTNITTSSVAGVQARIPASLLYEASMPSTGTPYWVDLTLSNSTAGICSFAVSSVIIEEL